jgi:hypothetical protein
MSWYSKKKRGKYTNVIHHGKILVKFDRLIRYSKEVRENVSIISEQPSYSSIHA